VSTFYLRIEGVNLSYVLEDTDQLSVVRGGSLLLRQAVKDIEARFPNLKKISTGASIGLFEFKDDQPTAEKLRNDIAHYLNTHANYKHLTFVVDAQEARAGFLIDKEAVLARNRFRQMQQLSLTMPDRNTSIYEPCEWDGVRPGDSCVEVRRDQGIERPPVSASIASRHNYGRKQKQKFYREETKEKGYVDPAIQSLDFAEDLHEIGGGSCFSILNDKIAVIYLDGNKFSKVQRHHCQDAASQDAWDTYIQGKRREFLKAFLLKCNADPDFHLKLDDNKLRLETLLWGGDEITLVVPAWRGFQTLHYFFQQAAPWEFKQPLTHAGGIAFCHVKTPIYRIQALAKNLADNVKDFLNGRNEDRYEYMVLESIDYPTERLDRFWEQRFGGFSDCRQPLPPIPDWEAQAVKLRTLLSGDDASEGRELPKGQVYALVRAVLGSENQSDRLINFARQLRRLKELVGKDKLQRIETTLEQLFPSDCPVWPWLHLFELWDYLVPERKPGKVGSRGAP
jgi:hypothetical protein